MIKGIIFDIKRYAIHDGPGIRTTIFLKGCPLSCPWCHNPEGVYSNPEIFFYSKRCDKECSECVTACPNNAIYKNEASIKIDHEKCDSCGICEDVCVYEALKIVGKEVSVQDVMSEIEKDRIFFDESGGGVTLSGGEPLAQPDFLESLLLEIKKKRINVAVDTSGYASFEDLDTITDKVDLLLYDLKIMDDEEHKKYTGVSNDVILKNLRRLTEKGKPIAVRIPLISGVNSDSHNIEMIAEYLYSLKNIRQINLLPYHKGGYEKSKRLRERGKFMSFKPPANERIEEIRRFLSDSGYVVNIGG